VEAVYRRRVHQFLDSTESVVKFPKLVPNRNFSKNDVAGNEGELISDLERFDEGERDGEDGEDGEASEAEIEKSASEVDEDEELSQKSNQPNSDQAGGQNKLIKLDNGAFFFLHLKHT
jgi:hypothetical protein